MPCRNLNFIHFFQIYCFYWFRTNGNLFLLFFLSIFFIFFIFNDFLFSFSLFIYFILLLNAFFYLFICFIYKNWIEYLYFSGKFKLGNIFFLYAYPIYLPQFFNKLQSLIFHLGKVLIFLLKYLILLFKTIWQSFILWSNISNENWSIWKNSYRQ